MQNSESSQSLKPIEDSSCTISKSTTNTARPILVKKQDSVKRRSRTMTSKNIPANPAKLNSQKHDHADKENIQPNYQRDASLKELNALSALKRLSDFNDFDDSSKNMLDETFRGINGWNANTTATTQEINPFSQRVLKDNNVINKRGNLMKKEANQVQSFNNNKNNNSININNNNNNNNYAYKNILTNMSNNINTYEKKANQLLNMKESYIEGEDDMRANMNQMGGLGNIVQDLKKLQEDLQSPEKRHPEQDNQINGGCYIKPLNQNLQKQQHEKKFLLKQSNVDQITNSQNRYTIQNGTPSAFTINNNNNTDPNNKNVQSLLTKVTSADKSLKMKFNEDYSIHVISNLTGKNQDETNNTINTHQNNTCSSQNNTNSSQNNICTSQNTAYLNTSSSTQDIDHIQSQLNQPYIRSRIESYSHVVDSNILKEITLRKKNQVIRVADTERYDKSFVQFPINLKNQIHTNPDDNDGAHPQQTESQDQKVQSPTTTTTIVDSFGQIKSRIQAQSEDRRSKSIDGAKSHQLMSLQNTGNQKNMLHYNNENTANNSLLIAASAAVVAVGSDQPPIVKISKSIQIGKSNNTLGEHSTQQSRTQVTNTPNSMISQKSKDTDFNVRIFSHLSDMQHEKKGIQSRLNDNNNNTELNHPYNANSHINNIFYQPSHIPLTPHQFSQSLSRNSYNPKFISQANSEKSKNNDISWSKSLNQNSQSFKTQYSVSLDKRQQLPSSSNSSAASTLIIYTAHPSSAMHNPTSSSVHNPSSAVHNASYSLPSNQQQPQSSQNLYNVLQKRIQQGSLSINSTITQQNGQMRVNGQNQGNGPSRNNSSNKLILPPKPQSSNSNVISNIAQNQQQNKNKLPKLFKNSNRTFLKKVNSRNEEIKGLQIQAQKAISNSFL